MLYINPNDFIASVNRVAKKTQIRMALRLAARSRLEKDEILRLLENLRTYVVFGEVGVTRRVIYMRFDGRFLTVRELIDGDVTTAYDIDHDISVRDMNLELSVIDGIVAQIELARTTVLVEGVINHRRKGVNA